MRQNSRPVLDLCRLAAALLVITIHTAPLSDVSAGADFFLTRILARVAVPYFLCSRDISWKRASGTVWGTRWAKRRLSMPFLCFSICR